MLSEEERMRQRILPYEPPTGSTALHGRTSIATDFGHRLRDIDTPGTNLSLSDLTETYENTLRFLIERVRYLEHEVKGLKRTDFSLPRHEHTRLDSMRKIAELVLQRNFVPFGKYVAITFDGKLVGVADDAVGILKQVQSREEDLFVWRVGVGPIESW